MLFEIYFSNNKPQIGTSLKDVENTTYSIGRNFVSYDYSESDTYFCYRFRLRENATVEKFIQHYRNNMNLWEKSGGGKHFTYNHYSSPSWDMIWRARIQLNECIDKANQSEWFSIDESFKLDINNQDAQHEKLNHLHFIFETELVKNNSLGTITSDLFQLLESINNLVHIAEKWNSTDSTMAFDVFRVAEHSDLPTLEMSDDDYNRKQVYNFGYLELDFATIGKDLEACYCTNDMELVRAQEIKQQEWIRPFIAMKFSAPQDVSQEPDYDDYYAWCEKNRVEDYGYNYREPKYNPGRVILGEWLDRENYHLEHVMELHQRYPYFENIMIKDE